MMLSRIRMPMNKKSSSVVKLCTAFVQLCQDLADFSKSASAATFKWGVASAKAKLCTRSAFSKLGSKLGGGWTSWKQLRERLGTDAKSMIAQRPMVKGIAKLNK